MARRVFPIEFITRIVDRHGLVGEERQRVIDMFHEDIVPGLEQVLDECFATETRRGMIATGFARLFTCFPEETRRRSFLDLVDAFYDIRDKIVHLSFKSLLFNNGLTPAQMCQLVQGLKDRLSEDFIYRRFRHSRETLTKQELFQLVREVLPQDARAQARDFIERGGIVVSSIGLPYSIERTVPRVQDRRRGLMQLIDWQQSERERADQEYQETIEATAFEQFAMPIGTRSTPNRKYEKRPHKE